MEKSISLLDTLSGEQLASLLYQILSRLLPPSQGHQAELTARDSNRPAATGQLVVDPTIDAWEHTGIYPQGYTLPRNRLQLCLYQVVGIVQELLPQTSPTCILAGSAVYRNGPSVWKAVATWHAWAPVFVLSCGLLSFAFP